MDKKPLFKVKPIETRYDGYKFRSRLEARWAIFFNALKIPYLYEVDGFDLEGTWYLPDFYLPKHDCFIEIKGVEPTPDEIKKAELLSIYSLKRVYIFAGEVGKNTYGDRAYRFEPPFFDGSEAEPEIIWTVQRLYDANYMVSLTEDGTDLLLETSDKWGPDHNLGMEWDEVYGILEEASRNMLPAIGLLRKHHQKLLEFLIKHPSLKNPSWDMEKCLIGSGFSWRECANCSEIVIDEDYLGGPYNTQKPCNCEALTDPNAPRILDAYRLAREARF